MSDRSVHYQYLEKRSQDILRRKPDKGYPDAGSMAKYYMGSCLTGGFPTHILLTILPCLKKPKKNERSELNAYFKEYYYKKINLV